MCWGWSNTSGVHRFPFGGATKRVHDSGLPLRLCIPPDPINTSAASLNASPLSAHTNERLPVAGGTIEHAGERAHMETGATPSTAKIESATAEPCDSPTTATAAPCDSPTTGALVHAGGAGVTERKEAVRYQAPVTPPLVPPYEAASLCKIPETAAMAHTNKATAGIAAPGACPCTNPEMVAAVPQGNPATAEWTAALVPQSDATTAATAAALPCTSLQTTALAPPSGPAMGGAAGGCSSGGGAATQGQPPAAMAMALPADAATTSHNSLLESTAALLADNSPATSLQCKLPVPEAMPPSVSITSGPQDASCMKSVSRTTDPPCPRSDSNGGLPLVPDADFQAACDAVDGIATGHMMFVPLLHPSTVSKLLSCHPPTTLAVLQLVNAPSGHAFDFVDEYLVTSFGHTLSYALILARYAACL
jgi:hypothetical protein